jgi:HTH-type transcriptional repressor of NAD biosynthesis genes
VLIRDGDTMKPYGITAIVCGKFYPPHAGHHRLIQMAVDNTDNVIVFVCWRADETLPVAIRMKCLQEEHPTVKIIPVPCIPSDDDSEGWGKYTMEILGYAPDVVYSSESYGEPYAISMGAEHEMVDHDRKIFSISGTMIRENPLKYFKYLSPTMRSYYALRIVVVGAESTGTTTLAKALSEHYKTVCVPEYGRTYTEQKYARGKEGWHSGEFHHIAKTQNELEDMYAKNANRLLICDTDSFATMLWCKRYCFKLPYTLVDFVKETNHNKYYIVTKDDIPFVQDEKGTRDGEHIRHDMHKQFIRMLECNNKRFIVVDGDMENRLRQSIKFIEGLVK